jgi:hypothetical protein
LWAFAQNPAPVADVPDAIVLKRHRDLEGREWQIWLRRGLLTVPFLAIVILALLNVFGQRPATSRASSPAASLKVYAPTRLRSGLLWQARFTIHANQDLRDAILRLGPGWFESTQANTIEPSPVSQASSNGKLSFDLGHIPAGHKYLLFLEFQTNPTNVGRRKRTVALFDGQTRLLGLDQTVTVWP